MTILINMPYLLFTSNMFIYTTISPQHKTSTLIIQVLYILCIILTVHLLSVSKFWNVVQFYLCFYIDLVVLLTNLFHTFINFDYWCQEKMFAPGCEGLLLDVRGQLHAVRHLGRLLLLHFLRHHPGFHGNPNPPQTGTYWWRGSRRVRILRCIIKGAVALDLQ